MAAPGSNSSSWQKIFADNTFVGFGGCPVLVALNEADYLNVNAAAEDVLNIYNQREKDKYIIIKRTDKDKISYFFFIPDPRQFNKRNLAFELLIKGKTDPSGYNKLTTFYLKLGLNLDKPKLDTGSQENLKEAEIQHRRNKAAQTSAMLIQTKMAKDAAEQKIRALSIELETVKKANEETKQEMIGLENENATLRLLLAQEKQKVSEMKQQIVEAEKPKQAGLEFTAVKQQAPTKEKVKVFADVSVDSDDENEVDDAKVENKDTTEAAQQRKEKRKFDELTTGQSEGDAKSKEPLGKRTRVDAGKWQGFAEKINTQNLASKNPVQMPPAKPLAAEHGNQPEYAQKLTI